MSSSPVTEVFDRAARLAVRYELPEIDTDILLVALDFEGGLARPIDLSKIDALLSKCRRANVELAELSSRESSGAGHSSGWIGLSSETKAALAPFGRLDGMTIDSLRAVLVAAHNKADTDRQS
jgi:hypothetical protein